MQRCMADEDTQDLCLVPNILGEMGREKEIQEKNMGWNTLKKHELVVVMPLISEL